jgi:hypothetical protein
LHRRLAEPAVSCNEGVAGFALRSVGREHGGTFRGPDGDKVMIYGFAAVILVAGKVPAVGEAAGVTFLDFSPFRFK